MSSQNQAVCPRLAIHLPILKEMIVCAWGWVQGDRQTERKRVLTNLFLVCSQLYMRACHVCICVCISASICVNACVCVRVLSMICAYPVNNSSMSPQVRCQGKYLIVWRLNVAVDLGQSCSTHPWLPPRHSSRSKQSAIGFSHNWIVCNQYMLPYVLRPTIRVHVHVHTPMAASACQQFQVPTALL